MRYWQWSVILSDRRFWQRTTKGVRASGQRSSSIAIYPLVVWALVVLYPLVLLWALRDGVSPLYSYMGFGYDSRLPLGVGIVGYVLAVLPGIFLPIRSIRPGTLAIWLLYFLVFVPSMIVPPYASGRGTEYVPFQVLFLVGFLLVIWMERWLTPQIRRPVLSESLFFLVIGIFTGITYLWIILMFGLPTSIPGLFDIYSVRADFETAATQAGLLNYLMSWQGKVINPFLMVHGIVRRRPVEFGIGLGLEVMLFALAGHKSVLFSVLLVIAVLIAYINRGRFVGLLVALGTTMLVVTSMALWYGTSSIILLTMFVRRLILVPGLLTGYYHEFFSSNPTTHQLDPISRALFSSPYSEATPHLIGKLYFDSPNTAANVNPWADAYSAFGYAGLIGISVAIGSTLVAFNTVSKDRDYRIAAVLTTVAMFNFVNSAFATSLATHGILIAALMLWFYPEARSVSKFNRIRHQRSLQRKSD